MRCTHCQRFFSCKVNYEIFCLVVAYFATTRYHFQTLFWFFINTTCRFYKERHRRIDYKETLPLLFYQQYAFLLPSISQKSFFHRYINRSKISDKIPLFHNFHSLSSKFFLSRRICKNKGL